MQTILLLSSQVSADIKSLKEPIGKSNKRVIVYVGITRMGRIAQLDVGVGTALIELKMRRERF